MNGNSATGPVNSPYTSFLASDVDGDGKTDLVLMSVGPGYALAFQATVMLNGGSGQFGVPIRTPAADGIGNFYDFALGDFRHTGRPDLLTLAGYLNDELAFEPNIGAGQFGSPERSPLGLGSGPAVIAVGDFNRDGNLDFVIAGAPFSISTPAITVTVYLGKGDGTFTAQPPINVPNNSPGHWVQGLWAGDFNGDGNLDLLLWLYVNTVPDQNDDVYELLGNGDGTFAAPKMVVSNLSEFAVADLNHDGRPDIVETTTIFSQSTASVGTPRFRIYLCQPDGSFVLAHTYAPYTGTVWEPLAAFGTAGGGATTPLIGDYNGDGNVDIASFQEDSTFGTERKYVQFLMGNGDGSFTPTYTYFYFNRSFPSNAFDVLGLGSSQMVEVDGWMSSFHVIPSQPGPALQMNLVSNPVIGAQGAVHIGLAVPAAAGTSVALTTSDPAISIGSSVSVPQGSLGINVPFQIGSGVNAAHVFSVSGTLAGSTATAYGTQALATGRYGVSLGLNLPNQALMPGQTSSDYGVNVASQAGYATTVTLSCQGLPAGTACQFGTTTLSVVAGGAVSTSLFLTTSQSTPLGNYHFSVVATDGAITSTIPAGLNVVPPPSFSFSLAPTGLKTLPNTTVTGTLTLTVVNDRGPFSLTCTGLPAQVTCSLASAALMPGSNSFTIQTNGLAPGNYTFFVTVTDGRNTQSASAQLTVQDFTATISPTDVNLSVGQSTTVNIGVSGVNGFTDPVSLLCIAAPVGTQCTIRPAVVTPTPGSVPATMTILVNSQPAANRIKAKHQPYFGLLILFPLGLVFASAFTPALDGARR